MRPNVLAEGAVSPLNALPAKRLRSSCVQGCEGQRIATVSWPPVTKSPQRADFGSTIVSGPGQKRSARILASTGTTEAQCGSASGPATCTISGCVVGRFFTAKVLKTASRLSASAARP